MEVLTFLSLLLPRSILNFLWSFVVNRFHDIAWRDGINHNLRGMNSSPVNVLAQYMVLIDG
jgi:hypothetical protein